MDDHEIEAIKHLIFSEIAWGNLYEKIFYKNYIIKYRRRWNYISGEIKQHEKRWKVKGVFPKTLEFYLQRDKPKSI